MVFTKKKVKDKLPEVQQTPKVIKKELQNSINETKPKHSKIATGGQSFAYDIELYDVWDTTSKRIPFFGANMIYDKSNTYLENPKNGFKEPFPENTDDYKQYKTSELKNKISNIEKKIRLVEKGKEDLSLRDLMKQKRICNNYLRSLELQGRGSYMIINTNGKPMFMFDRVGNLKMPIFKNVDRSLIYTPTEGKTREVSNLLIENDEKNGEQKRLNITTYALIFFLGLMVVGTFYFSYKMNQLPTDYIEGLSDVIKNVNILSNNLVDASSSLENVSSKIAIDPDLLTTPNVQQVTGR